MCTISPPVLDCRVNRGIKVGNTRGNEVIMYRTGFFTETEWFSDVFMSGGSNDSFVNSCWFFGNKNEGTLTPSNWKIYAIGSGSGKTSMVNGSELSSPGYAVVVS